MSDKCPNILAKLYRNLRDGEEAGVLSCQQVLGSKKSVEHFADFFENHKLEFDLLEENVIRFIANFVKIRDAEHFQELVSVARVMPRFFATCVSEINQNNIDNSQKKENHVDEDDL